jgi:hypothetical protein
MWIRILLLITAAVLVGCQSAKHADLPPFADIHLHYNWDHDEYFSPEQAIEQLKQHNVVMAAVSSVPSDFALKLADAGRGWVVPFYTPYYHAGNRLNWFFDMQVVDKTREALASGRYFGIGEVHLVAGIGPRRDNPVFQGLLQLAQEFKVPMLIHTDASDYRYMLSICQQHPDVRFQWAHAGGILQPEGLSRLMQACPNVWAELSARDHWHYGQFLDEQDRLPADWRDWIIRFQDRIMVGIDPVWNAHQVYRWYEADQGWKHYAQLHNYHRTWMQQLPPEVEQKLRLTNAQRFYDYALQKLN